MSTVPWMRPDPRPGDLHGRRDALSAGSGRARYGVWSCSVGTGQRETCRPGRPPPGPCAGPRGCRRSRPSRTGRPDLRGRRGRRRRARRRPAARRRPGAAGRGAARCGRRPVGLRRRARPGGCGGPSTARRLHPPRPRWRRTPDASAAARGPARAGQGRSGRRSRRRALHPHGQLDRLVPRQDADDAGQVGRVPGAHEHVVDAGVHRSVQLGEDRELDLARSLMPTSPWWPSLARYTSTNAAATASFSAAGEGSRQNRRTGRYGVPGGRPPGRW